MATARGTLIAFEGIDGSGKTVLSRMLAAELEGAAPGSVRWLREPGDSPWGKRIRELARSRESLPVEEQLRLFIEDRRWDVRTNIAPALAAGQTVIMDRYFYSTACYQGARGVNPETILARNRQFAPEADLVLIVDVDVDTALKRILRNRDETAPLFEKKEFLERVRAHYLRLQGPPFRVIDGRQPVEEVYAGVRRQVDSFLAGRGGLPGTE